MSRIRARSLTRRASPGWLCACVLLGACATFSGSRGPREAAPEADPDFPWIADVRFPPARARPQPETERMIARAIAKLDSAEFARYSAGSRELVKLGEPARPYLGHFADLPETGHAARDRARIVLETQFGHAPSSMLRPALASDYELVRAAAATAVGERRMVEHASELVVLLEDESLRVRRAAVSALRRISNRFFGYSPSDPAEKRAPAVAQWRRLWAQPD